MSHVELSILQNDEVRARTSAATRSVLEQRAEPALRQRRFLSDEQFQLLQELVDAILPQSSVGTLVPVADTIDRRLQAGINDGWRYATLPSNGEAYQRGLTALHATLQQAPTKTFANMPIAARADFLRHVAKGDFDGPAQYPLSTWLKVVRGDVVKAWVSHPDGMRAMQYFGFADGATGNEGWTAIGPNSAMPFEHGGTSRNTASAAEGGRP